MAKATSHQLTEEQFEGLLENAPVYGTTDDGNKVNVVINGTDADLLEDLE